MLAIDPKEMTISKESRDAQGIEADLFESIGGDDPTGLSFLDGDEVPIRSALEDEDEDATSSRRARRKRSSSAIEEPWVKEPKGWANILPSLSRVTLGR